MRALVVGADGFVGRWLIRHLAAAGDRVAGLAGPHFRPPLEGADSVLQADVRDHAQVADAVGAARPDTVYYLAAVSQVDGRDRIEDAARIGLIGALNTFLASAELQQGVRFVYVSSSHVYGGGDEPLTEDSPVEPAGVYGAVKAASERALLTLAPACGVDVIVARPFNHIGPGQAATFVVPSLAQRVRDVQRGASTTIRVGSIRTIRDFTDVRDVVRAYRLLATRGTSGEIYNVASGAGTSVEELLAKMLDITRVTASVSVDPSLERPNERRVLVGRAAKLEALGWTREHSLSETLAEILRGHAIS